MTIEELLMPVEGDTRNTLKYKQECRTYIAELLYLAGLSTRDDRDMLPFDPIRPEGESVKPDENGLYMGYHRAIIRGRKG